MSTEPGTLIILSQVYPPDAASVGQHMHDAAAELARRGRRVRVVTSRRGYEDPSKAFPAREMRDGVDVVRVPLSSFGKKSLPVRAVAMFLFMTQCFWQAVTARKLECIVVSTSPPMCSFAAVLAGAIRRVPIKFWVMDLNPDQAIQLGIIKEKSLVARIFTWFNRVILRRAVDVVALDRFMAERLNRKVDASAKMHVMPPWPHDAHLDSVPHEKNPFRNAHGLDGKFVVMYSGNHGLTTPVRTVLRAALSLRQRDDIVFMFIGGGLGKKDVERTIAEHNPPNVRSLPYQPMDQLRYSLSAADVHLVTMSDGLVGIIHPCKIYGAMRIGRPVLFIGPTPSHASDLLDEGQCGWHVKDEDDKATAALIERIVAMPKAELAAMGQRGARLIDDKYSMARLRTAFCDVVEKGLPPVPALAPDAAAARAINRSGDVHSAA